jgi:hypothetical protein
MWKILAQSVKGTGHLRAGLPCQDSCLAEIFPTNRGPIAILACADGAGSAMFADTGAALACEALVRAVRSDLAEGQVVGDVERETALFWVDRARDELRLESERRDASLRELACTILLAVVGESDAAFVQVGDGAILVRDGARYRPVFWPQSGDYANSTYFVTEADFAVRMNFDRRSGGIEELALLTDGLQRLVLDYDAKLGHGPFFCPLFQRLRLTSDPDELGESLRMFLDSPRINDRSDDDKTLIMATRVPTFVDPIGAA